MEYSENLNKTFVYTHWSVPSKQLNPDGRFFNRNKSRYKYFYEMLLLSVLSVKKYFPNAKVVFNSDFDGIEFVKNTNIPIDEYNNVFEDFDITNPEAWPLAKIHSMSKMSEPFIHLDYDVFFVKHIPIYLNDYDLIVQGLEMYNKLTYHGEFYESLFESIRKRGVDILDEYPTYTAFNAGFMCFNKIDFIKEWYDAVIGVYNRLENNFIFMDGLLCEQHLLSHFARKYEYNVKLLLPLDSNDINDYYVHLLADTKYNYVIILKLIEHLEKNYPEYYKNTHNLKKIELDFPGYNLNFEAIGWKLL